MIQKSRLALITLILLGLLLTIGNMVYPNATRIILNILWFTSLSIAMTFIGMGVMAILGMKKEVGKMMEMFMEGSFSVIDLVSLIRQVVNLFVEKIKETLLTVAQLFSYILAISLYLGTLYMYKLVGKNYDITLMTVVITILGVGLLNSVTTSNNIRLMKTGWRQEFTKRFTKAFSDAFQIVLFVFFLTMDSTRLFYVPTDLNVPLRAGFSGFDLMARGFSLTDGKITMIIITMAVMTEVIRNTLKIVYSARQYYFSWATSEPENNKTEAQKSQNIKRATRLTFAESRDDLVKFVAYTTVLLIVFLIFPRLKLLSMAVGSLTLLIFDLTFPSRFLTKTQNEDLISRVLGKTLKI